MAPDRKPLVIADVTTDNKTDGCQISISGKVHDVTAFMDDHPGGGEVKPKATGKDATIDFSDNGDSQQ